MLQANLVREFFGASLTSAYAPDELLAHALGVLRTAPQRYPTDPEFRTISLYTRYNRARPGHLRVGDRVPEMRLVPLPADADGDGKEASSDGTAAASESSTDPVDFWSATLPSSSARPLLVIASSWS